ncbi:hypothetical protein [Streptomyces brasiliensis]|uniref:Secreted protein n=1 Tax=Streptomyces brasiliensis TaxID=1954 RepID=A0A917KV16_9ACTN|nr:hypothetical protein [Streptomyces brasiliensis]GGJ28176.1 hypothetical protein GCM10010121_044360 [Streptomyces brasiliensis]
MQTPRSTIVTAAVAAASAVAATGITYAAAASAPVPQVAPAAAAAAAEAALFGGDSGQSKGNGNKNENENFEEGRIHINERSYSSRPGDCITVVSGLGAKTLNIRNDSRKTVEVFRGAVCDNGAPVAVVGPRSQSDGVNTGHTEGIHVEDGVVGSFRVISHHKDWD